MMDTNVKAMAEPATGKSGNEKRVKPIGSHSAGTPPLFPLFLLECGKAVGRFPRVASGSQVE